MIFNIDDYRGKYVMHCESEEEAKDFCKYLNNIGKKWCNGESYLNQTNWKHYRNEICYNFNYGFVCSKGFYITNHYTILEWSDFMKNKFTKSDLKTGDVVLRRNGLVEIVFLETESLINKGGFNLLSKVEEDLTAEKDLCSKNWDIMAVRRPQEPGDCVFLAFDHKFGKLVYDREKDEEIKKEDVETAIKEISEKLELLKKFIKT